MQHFNFYDAHDLNIAKDSSQTDSIKRKLTERMENSKFFVLLFGENTKNLIRFVKRGSRTRYLLKPSYYCCKY